MRILAVASASGGCAAALVHGSDVLVEGSIGMQIGLADHIPGLLAALLQQGGAAEGIAVVVGPGSFTGLRAGIAAATGVALAAGIPITGVTVAEALAESLADSLAPLGQRPLWVATEARRGFVVLDIGGVPRSVALGAVPRPQTPIALAGDAANAVAAILAARDCNVMLTSARRPTPRHVAAIAARRLAGGLPPCPALPLYAEHPRISTAASAPRPPPMPA